MPKHTESADLLTAIILSVFRLNARLLEKGDRLVHPLGVTSARWQVLGAIAMAADAQTAPQIASAMGVTRQGVQKQLNLMIAEKLITPLANPRHERSPLHALTDTGRQTYAAAMDLQRVWAHALGEGLLPEDLATARSLLRSLENRLEVTPLPAARTSPRPTTPS